MARRRDRGPLGHQRPVLGQPLDDKSPDAQVGWGVKALGGVISEAAWSTKPSWSLVATEDRMIPPDAQRFMSKRAGAEVVEQKGSHAIFLSEPKAVVALVEKAAQSLSAR